MMTCPGWDATTGQNGQGGLWSVAGAMARECSGARASWGTQCSFLTDGLGLLSLRLYRLLPVGGAPLAGGEHLIPAQVGRLCWWHTLDPRPPRGDWT